jgi:hypothetical protein
MSLINDALKKAARQRAQEVDGLPPMPGGGHGRSYPQGGPKKMQMMILIGAAAVVLVVVSVVATGIMMNGRSQEAKPAVAAVPAPQPIPAQAAPKIVVQAAPVAITLPQAAPVVQAPTPTALPIPTPTSAPIVREAAPPPSNPVTIAVVAAQASTDQIQNLVDNFHISGARAAGDESKALVDGHVYKLNDVVDRSVGLRLVKVEEDRLTFVDRNGTTYVRTF